MEIRGVVSFLFAVQYVAATGAVIDCVDLSTNCAKQSNLCNVAAYDDLMNFYCKKTCNRDCTPFTTTTTKKPCKDVTPDCINKIALCSMSAFNLMTNTYCAKTCGRCI